MSAIGRLSPEVLVQVTEAVERRLGPALEKLGPTARAELEKQALSIARTAKKSHRSVVEAVERWLERVSQDVVEVASPKKGIPPSSVGLFKDTKAALERRLEMAEHPNTPVQTLTRLAQDAEGEVRYAVAMNPNTPLEVLAQLAKDPDPMVRMSVDVNPKSQILNLSR